jgi:O-methyltransferase involved in polyketide biosynthesis
MNLSDVSRTAILTLLAHAVASEKQDVDFDDPMAVLCLQRLMSVASGQEKRWITWQRRIIGTSDARAMARRVTAFDTSANHFISSNPRCTVVNLGCGLDTRFWRIENRDARYVDVDLPEVIALKRVLLGDQLRYELLSFSVLDPSWIDEVTSGGNGDFILLAEGLFMLLPEKDVKSLLQLLAQRLVRSQLVVEMADEKWTRGFWRLAFALQARVWGLNVSFVSGIKNPGQIESYGPGLKVIGDLKGSSIGPIVIVAINVG